MCENKSTDAPSKATHEGFQVALSETIRDTASTVARASTFFEWSSFWLGDCNIGAARLDIFSDGTVEWRAKLMSKSGGDSWGARFEFLDNHGLSLWLHGWLYSPSLSPPWAVVDWVSLNQLFFPAHLFPGVARVLMHSRC